MAADSTKTIKMEEMPLEIKTPKGIFILVLFLILSGNLFSQNNILDTISKSLQKSPSYFGDFSSRYTFIDAINYPVFNIKIAADFASKFKIGAGYAFIKTPARVDETIVNSSGQRIKLKAGLKFGYINCFADYVYYNTKNWQFSIPLLVGIGGAHTEYGYNNNNIVESKKLVLVYEPVVSGYYRILPWFAVGSDIGYRFMFINNKSIDQKFNSPAYAFKLIVFFSRAFETAFPNSKLPKSKWGKYFF
jgi:hypothetical protein